MGAAHAKVKRASLMSITGFVLIFLLTANATVFAEPYLQLDARPAVWLSILPDDEESLYSADLQFTLYALVNSDSGNIQGEGDGGIDGFFYLSAALIPKQLELSSPPDLGSIILDNIPIAVVGDMSYGTPPIDVDRNPDEISRHGIFDTYYFEHEFALNPAENPPVAVYNSQENPGGPDLTTTGLLYYEDFEVDISGLHPDYAIHFDLYTKTPDGTLEFFAPFSHDLTTTHTPTPGAVLLGMLGLSVAGVKLRKVA